MAFVAWCEEEGVDIAIGVNSAAVLSAIPHLPPQVRLVARCANAFDHGYRITMAGRERLLAIIATTPRLQGDLVARYGADPELLVQIPNGVNPIIFERRPSGVRQRHKCLELGFLGRLEHRQKGVMHIPPVVKELNRRGVDFRLRIAGKGKHRAEMEDRLASEIATGQVQFVGALDPLEVPRFLKETDVLLFTSHFEGCPNVLLEALMVGCVPVCWLIEGITDYIVRDGQTGFLSPVGRSCIPGE